MRDELKIGQEVFFFVDCRKCISGDWVHSHWRPDKGYVVNSDADMVAIWRCGSLEIIPRCRVYADIDSAGIALRELNLQDGK